MRKILLFICMFIPVFTYAGTREVDMWSDFIKLTQPIPKLEVTQNGTYVRYIADEKTLTDKIVYTVGKKIWSTKWPWSLATTSMRKIVQDCKKSNSSLTASGCGWFDYKIIRLSPSGNYIELIGQWYESNMWRMLDTRTGKLVLSNNNGVAKSMWTKDRKQFIWQTFGCEIGGCSDPKWTFVTENGKFPKFKKINSDTN